MVVLVTLRVLGGGDEGVLGLALGGGLLEACVDEVHVPSVQWTTVGKGVLHVTVRQGAIVDSVCYATYYADMRPHIRNLGLMRVISMIDVTGVLYTVSWMTYSWTSC